MSSTDRPRPTADRRRVDELFARAIELEPSAHAEFLRDECAGDASLANQVRALLEAHEALQSKDPARPGFLEALVPSWTAALLDGLEAPVGEEWSDLRYRIVRPLGRGGMGRVYLARDPDLGRFVALKILPAHLSYDPAANRRFRQEARAASALDHPNVATIYEIGETDGRPFIAMAYCEGETLRERLRRAPLPIDEVTALAAQIADGLSAAHARGIVHRDIKPENLVVDERGTVKILDFGVAKVAAAALTRTGTTLGTVAYMSPEQTRSGPVDARADLWSLGVVLYEMLTGRRPFGGETNDAVIYGVRHDAPEPLRAARPDAPEGLAAVVERCLEKDPDRRFASADDLGVALRGVSDGARSVADRRGWPWTWMAAYVASAAVALLVSEYLAGRYLLPGWSVAGVQLLLLLGLPIVLATAAVRNGPSARRRSAGRAGSSALSRLLTWPRVAVAGVVAVVALAAASGWTVMGGQPRVTEARGTAGDAFPRRGWVLVADFEAGGSNDVAQAAREALAVDLQQSGFVNVLSRAQLSGTLRQMGRADTTRLVLPLALEVAERAGAGAVLTATVSRLGPHYILSGRALRPGSGEEMFAVRTAAGPGRLLGAVEALSREMRRRLGEEREAIRRSRPLPAVSTSSLEALRLYAEAERFAQSDYDAASTLVARAIEADSSFAMAHRLAGAMAYSRLRFGEADHHFTRAYALRDRLTERERWHVEAIYYATVRMAPRRAARLYELLLERYPDDVRAIFNLGSIRQSMLGEHEAAYGLYLRASEIDPGLIWLAHATHTAFMTGRGAAADSLARVAEARGFDGFARRWRLARAFALGDHRGAAAVCDSLLAAGSPGLFGDDREYCGSVDVAAGRLRTGITRLEAVERTYLEAGRHRNLAHAGQAVALAHELRGEPAAAAAVIERLLDRIPADAIEEPDRFITRTNLQVQAALLGRPDLVERIGRAYPPYPDADHWFGRAGDGLVAGALAVGEGDGREALDALGAGWSDDRPPIGWQVWNELLRGRAFDLVGEPDSAAVHYEAAADPRRLTFPYLTKDRIYLPVALRRLAAAHEARGDAAGAARAYGRLLELWADADPELRDEIEAVRTARARLIAD